MLVILWRFPNKHGYTARSEQLAYPYTPARPTSEAHLFPEVRCNAPEAAPANGIIRNQVVNYSYGNYINFECEREYKIIGDETAMCNKHGVWAGSFICERELPLQLHSDFRGRRKRHDPEDFVSSYIFLGGSNSRIFAQFMRFSTKV